MQRNSTFFADFRPDVSRRKPVETHPEDLRRYYTWLCIKRPELFRIGPISLFAMSMHAAIRHMAESQPSQWSPHCHLLEWVHIGQIMFHSIPFVLKSSCYTENLLRFFCEKFGSEVTRTSDDNKLIRWNTLALFGSQAPVSRPLKLIVEDWYDLLTEVFLVGVSLEAEEFACLNKLVNVTLLDIRFNSGVKVVDGFAYLARPFTFGSEQFGLRSLRHLRVDAANLTEMGMKHLSNLPKLCCIEAGASGYDINLLCSETLGWKYRKGTIRVNYKELSESPISKHVRLHASKPQEKYSLAAPALVLTRPLAMKRKASEEPPIN